MSQMARGFGGQRFQGAARIESQLRSQYGEDKRVLYAQHGNHVQGDITEAAAEASEGNRVRGLEVGGSQRGREWAKLMKLSWGGSI